MSDELYLILHKVQGQPAFDIAVREWYGDEEGWMLKTTEQRCWPYQQWKVDSLCERGDGGTTWDLFQNPMPDDLPDFHFQPPPSAAPKAILTNARDLLAKLGLARSAPPIKRRKI